MPLTLQSYHPVSELPDVKTRLSPWASQEAELSAKSVRIPVVSVQDTPPQNMPLRYIDYFEPKAREKPPVLGESFSELPSSA